LKIVRAALKGKIFIGVLRDGTVQCVEGDPFDALNETDKTYPVEAVRLLAPVKPQKIVAVGLNYRSHADELSMEVKKDPIIFLKPQSAVIGPLDEIVIPEMSERVDYEAELGVVIGKTCRNVAPEAVPGYIFGYTCVNDVTARDLQKTDGQWTRAKGFDTFCPIGPWVETDYDWKGKRVQAVLNGEVKQDAATDDLINGVERLVSFISRVMTLCPGDVIATGTPKGIGPMQPGDTIEIVVEGIGTLKNTVKTA